MSECFGFLMKSHWSKFHAPHCPALGSVLCCHRGEFSFVTLGAVATLKTGARFASRAPVGWGGRSDAPDSLQERPRALYLGLPL